MRLKNEMNQKKDLVYLIIAVVLTVLLAVYLLWFVYTLAQKANTVFTSAPTDIQVTTFDFERYERIIGGSTASSTQP